MRLVSTIGVHLLFGVREAQMTSTCTCNLCLRAVTRGQITNLEAVTDCWCRAIGFRSNRTLNRHSLPPSPLVRLFSGHVRLSQAPDWDSLGFQALDWSSLGCQLLDRSFLGYDRGIPQSEVCSGNYSTIGNRCRNWTVLVTG
jgi:hypothetical protein